MRVLLVGHDGDTTAQLADALTDADVEVARCHDPGRPTFPCHGLLGNRDCPLEGPAISAVVTATGRPGIDDDVEAGTSCALRRHVPLVLVGGRESSPLAPFAASHADEPDELVEAINAAIAAPLRDHEAVAVAMFRQVLDKHDLFDVRAAARVTRKGRGLRVVLQPSLAIPDVVAEVACVRVAGALRKVDSTSPDINVGVECTSSCCALGPC
jgi:hypothetical protein